MDERNRISAPSSIEGTATQLLGREIFFPGGLLGFPNDQSYKLIRFTPGDGSESPFYILESTNQSVSFPLIHPDYLSIDYHLPVAPELMESLKARNEADLVPWLIVTVRERVQDITVNLQGPLLINRASLIGIQLVLEDYPLRHPLFGSSVL
jgi:flagellar assembly factor FliW